MLKNPLRRALLVFALVITVTAATTACQPHEIALAQRIAQQREAVQMHPFLTCVRHHESDRGPFPHTNGYGEKNPYSSASGAYQFLDSTWRVVAARAGHSDYAYSPARYAPIWVQDDVAYDTAIRRGERYHWNGTGC